jgi:hypothetical protein
MLPKKPGSFDVGAGVLFGLLPSPNMRVGSRARFVLLHPALADSFIEVMMPGDFFLMRAGSLDHGMLGTFGIDHSVGFIQVGTLGELVAPDNGGPARQWATAEN